MLKLSLEKCARQNSRRKDTRATVGTKTLRPAVVGTQLARFPRSTTHKRQIHD